MVIMEGASKSRIRANNTKIYLGLKEHKRPQGNSGNG